MIRFAPRSPAVPREGAMSVRPVRVDVKVERSDGGGARLIVPVRPRRWLGIKPGATRKFELDELGLFVWERCDGSNTVAQIIDAVATRSGGTQKQAETATRSFLHTLARR